MAFVEDLKSKDIYKPILSLILLTEELESIIELLKLGSQRWKI